LSEVRVAHTRSQDLLALLEKDEIFKDPELNSETVREMLATNRTYLSRVINQDMNTTFYQLINTYRLKKAVEMMKNPMHKDTQLKYIAKICGFKSLGAFSTLFKQAYGKTPTEWKVEVMDTVLE
jgi:AraC-like DNA-binding protein